MQIWERNSDLNEIGNECLKVSPLQGFDSKKKKKTTIWTKPIIIKNPKFNSAKLNFE